MKKITFWKSLFLLCALIVGSVNGWADKVTFDASSDKGNVTSNGTVSGGDNVTKDGITISSSNGPMGNGSNYRFYQNGKCTVSSTVGNITKIEITCTGSGTADYSPSKLSGTGYSYSGSLGTWQGTASASVELSASAQCRASKIEVTYTPSGGGNTDPSISLGSTSINATKAAVANGTINVTYNNISTPNSEVVFYESTGTTAVEAATYDWINASINSSNNVAYTISANSGSKRTAYMKVHQKNTEVYSSLITVTQASGIETPTFDPVGGTYTTNQNVTISCATENATIYYTIDGSDPDNTKNVYSTSIAITNSGTVLKAIAYTNAGNSEIASATYTIRPIAPTISYVGSTVTITGPDGCTLYYTTNGDTPNNNSTEYTGPFDLNADCSIKAVAYDTYNNKGTVKTTNFKYLEISPKNINSGYYEKVTDASTLENGDAILIVYETGNCAMSTTQGSNNRDNTSVSISAQTNSIYAPAASVQKLVLVKNTESISNVETDVFYFYTGSGYLYAAGANSNNYLRTSLMPDEKNNSRATISISSGNATIAFQGESSRNHMRYNNSNDQKKFSCYASNASFPLVQIYKEVAKNESATISNAEYATFNNATYALDFSETGISVYTATDNETSVTLNEITSGKVPANTPVVLYKEGADGTAINVPVIASADAVGDNDLRVSTGTDTYKSRMYVLANKGKVGFYKWASTSNLSAGKVYLLAKESYNEAREFLGFDENVANGIANVDVNANDNFDANAPMYNLAGQRVNKSYKGVVIMNGKKMLNK